MDQLDDIRTSEVIDNNIDLRCAPNVKFEDGSCYSLVVLMEMANAYNKTNNNKIKLYPSFETLNPKKYKKYLLREFKRRHNKCHNQQCWAEQSFIDNLNQKVQEEIRNHTFRPEGPDGKFEWLNTININEVMEQYEKKYPDFKFLGAVPIDFDDLPVLGLRDINFSQLLSEGKSKIGIIFNLDEHDKSGSHWVGLYSDIKKGTVYFFDSYGIRPEYRIRKFMRRIAKYCQTGLGIKQPVCDHNKLRHQYEGSECGVYSINFIIRMLRGESFEDISKKRLPDETINKCRNTYFRNVNI